MVNWGFKQPGWEKVFKLSFNLAYLLAFLAGLAMILHTKEVRDDGGKLNPSTTGLLFAVKLLKFPEVFNQFRKSDDYTWRGMYRSYKGVMTTGLIAAIAIWAAALAENIR